jgi:hypothetical protein
MLSDVMQFEDPGKNPYVKVKSTRMVGYPDGDEISYTQTRGYMTVFAWLKEQSNDPESIDVSMLMFSSTTCINWSFYRRLHPQATCVFWLTVGILTLSVLENTCMNTPAF